MKSNNLILLLVVLGISEIKNSKAFQCGLKNQPSDKLRDILSQCLKGDQTLDKLLELGNSSTDQQNPSDDSSADSENDEQQQSPRGSDLNSHKNNENSNTDSGNNNWNTKFSKIRYRRASVVDNHNGLAGMHRILMPRINRDELMKITGKTYPNIASSTEKSDSATTLENDDSSVDSDNDDNSNNDGSDENFMCAAKCVFEKLEMNDSNGLPDHEKLLNGLLESANSRDLRNFLQKSANECFQQMEEDDSQDPCKYSVKIAACLAEKGRQDCADWPSTGSLPF